MDFYAKSSMSWDMINLDEIDRLKVRSGLFALIAARLAAIALSSEIRGGVYFSISSLRVQLSKLRYAHILLMLESELLIGNRWLHLCDKGGNRWANDFDFRD